MDQSIWGKITRPGKRATTLILYCGMLMADARFVVCTASGDGNVDKVVFSRSSAFIILMTNRHRLRVANRYIWQGMQDMDRLWKSIVGGATA